MKPVILYVDDEPRNLTVFEASMPSDWEVKCFDSAVDALKQLKTLRPWVIVSDQRMPGMTGLEFLEVAAQLIPEAVRIVVTGQTEESTIIQLIRRAKIFDYITKPWMTEDLTAQIEYAISFFRAHEERKTALALLEAKNRELELRNQELIKLGEELKAANQREVELREEICAWAPNPVVQALREQRLRFPMRRDLVGITYDIVGSSTLSGKLVAGKPIKSHVYWMFTECLIRKGGLRESSSGDSVYGHFGATESDVDPFKAAMAVVQEFRVALQGFSSMHGVEVECGIALHLAPSALVQIHEVRVDTPSGPVVQKSFETESSDIDLLHRMEKLLHELPGTNIAMSDAFLARLAERPTKLVGLGSTQLKGQENQVKLHLLPSDRLQPDQLEAFRAKHFAPPPQRKAG